MTEKENFTRNERKSKSLLEVQKVAINQNATLKGRNVHNTQRIWHRKITKVNPTPTPLCSPYGITHFSLFTVTELHALSAFTHIYIYI